MFIRNIGHRLCNGFILNRECERGSYDSYVTTHIRFVPVLLSYCQDYAQVDEYQRSIT